MIRHLKRGRDSSILADDDATVLKYSRQFDQREPDDFRLSAAGIGKGRHMLSPRVTGSTQPAS